MKRIGTHNINRDISETKYMDDAFIYSIHKVSSSKYIYVTRFKDTDRKPIIALEKMPLKTTKKVLQLLEREMPRISALIDKKSPNIWDIICHLEAACYILGR